MSPNESKFTKATLHCYPLKQAFCPETVPELNIELNMNNMILDFARMSNGEIAGRDVEMTRS